MSKRLIGLLIQSCACRIAVCQDITYPTSLVKCSRLKRKKKSCRCSPLGKRKNRYKCSPSKMRKRSCFNRNARSAKRKRGYRWNPQFPELRVIATWHLMRYTEKLVNRKEADDLWKPVLSVKCREKSGLTSVASEFIQVQNQKI